MKRHDAFTLTELLVLVPIIGLVGAVLFASLDSDKQTLQAAQCLSNMRQWGLAMGMYCNDNHDYIPYEGSANGVDDSIDLSAWFNVLPRYMNQPRLEDLYTSSPPNIPLPGQRSIHICPSAPNITHTPTSGAPYFSYAMNRVYNGASGHLRPRSIAALPSQVIFLSESENNQYPFTDGGFLGQVPPRHSGGMNFVFVDGHAQWYKLSDYSRTSTEASNPLLEWLTPRALYWYPCRACNKT